MTSLSWKSGLFLHSNLSKSHQNKNGMRYCPPYISLLFDQPYSEMPYSIFYYIETSHSRFYFTKTMHTRSSCLGCMCTYVYMHVHIRDQPLIIAWPLSTLFSDKRCHSQRWSLTSVLWLVASEPKTSVSTSLAFKLQAWEITSSFPM